MSAYLKVLYAQLQKALKDSLKHQDKMLLAFTSKAKNTETGREFGFKSINSYRDYTRQVPIRDYDNIRTLIIRMMEGQTNILWPGLITWFAKSSGTTGDKSKFIPVTTEHLNHTHNRTGWYTLALHHHRNPTMRVFADKNLVMTGSISKAAHPAIRFGDVSAIMRHHMPWIGRPFFTPNVKITLMPEWEKKIEIMADVCGKANVGMFAGVPTWTLVLIKRMLEIYDCDHMLEIWPNAAGYLHGGVGFGPYEDQFRKLFPSPKFLYQEIYNASEGYFAAQDTSDRQEGLLLFPDNGIFYEFIPEGQWHSSDPEAIPLRDVEADKPYAMVITTNGGLWRYKIGDTVKFTSLDPYRISITGRTKQHINTFGEEVMVDNTDKAVELTSKKLGAMVSDYTVAPVHLTLEGKGGHHWLIEFDKTPHDVNAFADELDRALQNLNGDYEAKRYMDMALVRLKLTVLPKGTFRKWLTRKGKSGSQAKIPRLSNERKYLEEILEMADHTFAEK